MQPELTSKYCYVPGVTRKKSGKPNCGIWKVSKRHFLNLHKFIKKKYQNYQLQKAMEYIYTINESLIYNYLYV